MKEQFPHDVCPLCGWDTIPAEGVPDQTLRRCKSCSHDFFEDMNRPATKSKPARIEIRTTLPRKSAYVRACNGAKLVPTILAVLDKWAGFTDKPEQGKDNDK